MIIPNDSKIYLMFCIDEKSTKAKNNLGDGRIYADSLIENEKDLYWVAAPFDGNFYQAKHSKNGKYDLDTTYTKVELTEQQLSNPIFVKNIEKYREIKGCSSI